jgi:dTDP-4-amino-4,6-dideoxygalactose transaminase
MMMSSHKVPINDLSRSSVESGLSLSDEVQFVLKSGVFLGGVYVKSLESEVGSQLEGGYCVGVACGSDALFLALSGLGIKAGDQVVTVGNSAGYATNAILRVGAVPVLVDINPESAQMSDEALEQVLLGLPRIRAVVVTHLYGLMGNLRAIVEICRKEQILLVEDCAQSFGATYGGATAGSFGDAAAFSFYPTKNLAALGDGGMVAFKDSEACARARKIAQYGWSSRYEVELPYGINSRLDEIQAAVVLHRLSSVDLSNSRRRDILRRYAEAVTVPRRFIFEDSERCVAHLAVMRTPTRDRDRAVLNSFRIETAIHYPIPDHKQPAWRHLFEGVVLPNTEAHCAEVLTLPCFPELTEEEIVRVCEALQSL